MTSSPDLDSFISTFANDAEKGTVRNGYALFLYQRNESDLKVTATQIDQLLQKRDSSYTSKQLTVLQNLKYMMNQINSWKRRLSSNWMRIQDLLERPVQVPRSRKKQMPSTSLAETEDVLEDVDHAQEISTPVQKLRNDCERCETTRQEWIDKYNVLDSKLKKMRVSFKSLSGLYKVKLVNRMKNRKNEVIRKLRQENQRLKVELRVAKKFKPKTSVVNKSYYKEKLVLSRKELKNVKDKVNRMVAKLRQLEEQRKDFELDTTRLEHVEKDVECLKKPTMFDPSTRKCIYSCILHQVPFEKTCSLIKFIVHELTGISFTALPCTGTISNMALELGILSDLQVGELMFKENELTLSWDSTPLDGQQINSCHISSKHQNLTLQTFGMPGGTTEDYLEHILNAIHDIGCQYSTYHGIQQHIVLYTLFKSLQATLTDRAKVNKCVSDKLEEMVDRKLVQLKCFLHPLDGMASEARKELKKLDVDWSVSTSLYGHEGSAANLVHALSKLRYKENSRDPKGFKAYLLREGLKKTYIPRYVGNRLHVLFLLAGIIYKIKDSLAVYLEKFCKSMKLREAIEKDLTNPDVMVQIRVLGLFGKLLTGPWRKLFYNKSSGLRELSHLEMTPFVRRSITTLKELQLNPASILTLEFDVFGHPLLVDDVLVVLRDVELQPGERFFRTVSVLASCFVKVLERQLDDYLTGDLANPTEAMMLQTSSAPLHNIHSERVLGMVDSQFHRAPNASFGFVDAKVKCQANKTMDWLLAKPVKEQGSLIKFAVRQARKQRKVLEERVQVMGKTIMSRQIVIGQKRDKTERKKVEKKVLGCLEKDAGFGNDIFVALSTETKLILSSLLSERFDCLPLSIRHVWDVDGKDQVFDGKIVRYVKKGQKKCCRIVWDSEGQTDIPTTQIITDVVMGDFHFV
ncbi:uncharacterized protein LOC106069644 [Biomphalaria glabrata]|uniref:Uncharacterized protein LOC106069644 n=1 Tax=Biomphalaria glabrata TaxID=6526 RepID=A0A9W3A817_BIOGL|nr:uncharacterized protein LOC106069644 [Biomphalaria glabrata]